MPPFVTGLSIVSMRVKTVCHIKNLPAVAAGRFCLRISKWLYGFLISEYLAETAADIVSRLTGLGAYKKLFGWTKFDHFSKEHETRIV